jgi:acetolactate synthase-1/2/3 large subunit
MTNITVANYIYNKLKNKGINHVFGYSGGALLPLLDTFYNSNKIKFIKNSNEQCSGYVSEGYSKSLNMKIPGVILSTSGPGLTNIITPLQNAYSDGTPLIAISAQVPLTAIGTDAFQECDAINITKHCTKWNYQIKSKYEIDYILDKAFNISMKSRKGPVHIDIPKNILLETINTKLKTTYHPSEIFYNEKIKYNIINKNNINYNKIIELLNIANKPIIIAGQGCNNVKKELELFSNIYNIPVTTTLHGMGCYNENNKLSLEMLGMHGNPAANICIQEADLIIAIGTRFDDRTTGNVQKYANNAINAAYNNKGGIFHIDSSIEQIKKVNKLFNKYYNKNNVSEFLYSINDTSKNFFSIINQYKIKNNDKTEWIKKIKYYKNIYNYNYNENHELKGPDVIKCINKLIDINNIKKDDIIFTTGVGNHQMWTAQHIKWTSPNKMITSGSLGTMGVGVPFAIGCKLANPDKMVICIDGDSSFTMTSTELQTILENNINIKIIILNDKRQQMVYIWQKLFHNKRYIGTENINPNFEYLAKAYNIKTITCNSKLTLKNSIQNIMDYDKTIIGIFNIEPEMCFPLVAPGKGLDEMIMNSNDINNINKNVNAPN